MFNNNQSVAISQIDDYSVLIECIQIIQKKIVMSMIQDQQGSQFRNKTLEKFQSIIDNTKTRYDSSGLGRGFFVQQHFQIIENLQSYSNKPQPKNKQISKLESFKDSKKIQVFIPIKNQINRPGAVSKNIKKVVQTEQTQNLQILQSQVVAKNEQPLKNNQSQQDKIINIAETYKSGSFIFIEEDVSANQKPSIEEKRNQIIMLSSNQLTGKRLSSNNGESEIHIEPVIMDSRQRYLATSSKLTQEIHLPIRENCILKTQIIRNNSGFNTFWPQFTMAFFKNTKDRNFLFAKKTSSKPCSTFIISSVDGQFDEKSASYQGKVKSSGMGDILNVFNKGLNPGNAKQREIDPRQLLATIVYIVNAFQTGKPRQFQVYTIKHPFKYYTDFPQVKKYGNQIPLNQLYNYQENKHKIRVLKNKSPAWKEQLQGYMLNFRGRVNIASIKNFILEQDQKYIKKEVMLFGKVNENLFNADLNGPISVFISFAIALSSFDSRIISE